MNGSWTSKVVQAAVSAAVLVALVPVYAQTGPQQEERPVVSSATLREAFSISGIVLDPSGAVVVGATIFISEASSVSQDYLRAVIRFTSNSWVSNHMRRG